MGKMHETHKGSYEYNMSAKGAGGYLTLKIPAFSWSLIIWVEHDRRILLWNLLELSDWTQVEGLSSSLVLSNNLSNDFS